MKIQKFIGSNFRSGPINFLLLSAANENTSDQVSCRSQSLVIYHVIYPIQIVLCQNTIYFAVQQIKIMHRASYVSFDICSGELLLKTGCRKVQSN